MKLIGHSGTARGAGAGIQNRIPGSTPCVAPE
jgi:hypothetical protein